MATVCPSSRCFHLPFCFTGDFAIFSRSRNSAPNVYTRLTFEGRTASSFRPCSPVASIHFSPLISSHFGPRFEADLKAPRPPTPSSGLLPSLTPLIVILPPNSFSVGLRGFVVPCGYDIPQIPYGWCLTFSPRGRPFDPSEPDFCFLNPRSGTRPI